MNNEKDIEFLKKLGELTEKYITNYEGLLVLNPEQYEKFLKTEKLFRSFVERNEGEVIEHELNPKELHGALESILPCTNVVGTQEIVDFCQMIAASSNFEFLPRADGESMYFTITIPNIFKQVSN